jgi:hypothetical protein
MQSVTGNVNTVTTNVSRRKFSNVTRRCQQFSLYVASRSARSVNDTAIFNPCVSATFAHTNYAGNFRNTLYLFEKQFLLWLFSVLKIRVSLVRFRDWPPVIPRTPCLTARRFVLYVCKRAKTRQQRCVNFALTLFFVATHV